MSTNGNLSNSNKLQTSNNNDVNILATQCDYFATPNYETQCWLDGGIANGTTCASVITSYTTWSFCYQTISNTDLSSFDYSGLFGGSGTGSSTTNNPTLLDSLNAFNSKISDSLHPCLDSILQKLKGIDSGKIAAIIKKFSGEVPNWDLFFDEKETDPLHNANTDPYLVNGRIGVHLNYNNLSSATDLSAARTIIHESIHAYLAVYFASDPVLSKAEYPVQFDTWFSRESNGLTINRTQHDLMISNFLSDISDALEQFGVIRGYNLPKQFYNDMSWGGLLDLLKDYNPISELDKARIKNTILAEETNTKVGWVEPVGNKSCN